MIHISWLRVFQLIAIILRFPIVLRNEFIVDEKREEREKSLKQQKIHKLKINQIVRCASIHLQSNHFNQVYCQSSILMLINIISQSTVVYIEREKLISIDFVWFCVFLSNLSVFTAVIQSIFRQMGSRQSEREHSVTIRMNVNAFIANLHFPVKSSIKFVSC